MDSITRKKGAKRLQNSCDNCRRKKNILTLLPNKRSVVLNLSHHTAQSALVHAILAEPLTYQIPENFAGVRELLVDICHYVRSLEKDIARLRRAAVSSSGSAGSRPSPSPSAPDIEGVQSTSDPIISKSAIGTVFSDEDSDDIDTNTISENFKHLSLYHSRPRHYGMSSNFVLAQTLLEVDLQHGLDIGLLLKRFERPLFWTINPWQREVPFMTPDTPLVFPDSDLLHELVSIYFAEFDPYLPLLHRQTFEQCIKDGTHLRERCVGKVVLAVCALASRYSNDPRNMIPGAPCPEHSLGWPWFKQVAVVQTTSFIDPPRVYNLQLFVLSVVFLQGTTTSESSWIIIGTAIRLAEAIGVHRKGPGPSRPRTIERELWNRAFWALVNIDVTVSMFLGRPRATTFDDIDLELPADCDQEYWENPEDPEKNFIQPAGKPSLMSFWIHYTKLQQIAAAVHRLIYPIKKLDVWRRMGISVRAWHQRAVTEIDSLLNQWVDNIPEHVRWDPKRKDPVFRQQSVILYTTYYWVQVHKAFIPRPGQEAILTFPSLAICANAARCCIHASELQSPKIPVLPIHVLTPLFSAGIVLLLKLWRAKHTPDIGVDSEKELKALYECFDLLSNFSQRFQSAGRFIDILNAIISVGHLVPEEPTGDEEQEQYSLPSALDTPVAYPNTFKLPGHPPNRSNPLGPTEPVSVPEFILPFHTRELGEGESSLYSSPDLYGQVSSTSSLTDAIPWTACPEITNGVVIHDVAAPHATSSQAEQYDPKVVEFYNQYGPRQRWNDSSNNYWGPDSRPSPDGLGQDWNHFLSNVDGLFHSASGDFYAYPVT
ncbi:fungal-specific transcription factor domain-containing protein [Lentinula lateritia]|uniref:Fungal-specific transcription factor domain-containing protein n=1 Tax=Lentinula lateritia TaxID=40482 RepID=A0ABQ8VU66_9AGAR|nr:fungal-specific transcription factor domain-containing protein [Lentinula lateritia]